MKPLVGTHASKLFDAKLKQTSVYSRVLDTIPSAFTCSATIRGVREIWATPSSAGDMKVAKAEAAKSDYNPENIRIPEISSDRVKQVLLPQSVMQYNSQRGSNSERAVSAKQRTRPYIKTDEIKGVVQLVLLLRNGTYEGSSTEELATIAEAASELHRLGGGYITESTITVHEEEPAPEASYLADASDEVEYLLVHQPELDSLDAALSLYYADGFRDDTGRWVQKDHRYTLNATGYGYLHEPLHDKNSRYSRYGHVWVESLYLPIRQQVMNEGAWWRRYTEDWGVQWAKLDITSNYRVISNGR